MEAIVVPSDQVRALLIAAAELVVPATSFGGVESTWERRARWAAETAPETLMGVLQGIVGERMG